MSNETVAANDAASQEATQGNNPIDNWAALTNSEELNNDLKSVETNNEVKTDENQENTEGEENKPKEEQNTEAKTDESQEGEKKGEGETKEGETEPVVEEKPLIEFKAEDVEGSPESEPEDGTWMAVAKASGVEITEDSFEAYQSAVESKYKAEIEKVKSITEDEVLSKYSPEARATIELLNSGLTLEEIYAPNQMINELRSLDDASLVRKSLEEARDINGNKIWDADMIDTEIEALTEKGRLEHEAKKIRKNLDLTEQEIKTEHANKLKEYQDRKAQLAYQQKQQSIAQFEKAMTTVSEFMGGKISDEAKQAIVKKQQSGAYDNLLNDPKSLAEFVLYKEFGQKALKNLENTAFQRGREEKTKKLANVPPVTQNGSGRVITNEKTDNWAALKDLGS